MNKLIQELERLYFLPNDQRYRQVVEEEGANADQAEALLTYSEISDSLAGKRGIALKLLSFKQGVRTMVIGFARAGDWSHVASLCQVIQGDLEWPVPALSVSPKKGFQVWLSLAEPVVPEQAEAFLNALRHKYLSEIPLSRVTLQPSADDSAGVVALVPSYRQACQKWSAFIDPSMGSMFADELGLEMAPNLERQADMLASLKSITTRDFQRVLRLLHADVAVGVSYAEGELPPNTIERQSKSELRLSNHFTDPETFLLAVMNDSSVSIAERIHAAEALLPYLGSSQKTENKAR